MNLMNYAHTKIISKFSVLLLLLLPQLAFTQTIKLSDLNDKMGFGKVLEIYEDQSGNLKYEDIVSQEYSEKFVRSNEEFPNMGQTLSSFWFRFEIENNTKKVRQFLLSLGKSHIHYIDLYVKVPFGNTRTYKTGAMLPFATRQVSHNYFTFRFSIPPNQTLKFHAKVWGKTLLTLSFNLFSPTYFYESNRIDTYIIGIFYGSMIILFFYNFFLLVSVRDEIYLFYIAYIGSALVWTMIHKGFASEFIYPNFPMVNSTAAGGFATLALSNGFLFVCKFLEIKKVQPKLYLCVKIWVGVLCSTFFIFMIFPFVGNKLINVMVLVDFLFLLAISIVAGIYRTPAFQYYFVSMIFLIAGTGTHLLSRVNIIEPNKLTWFSIEIAVVLEALFLSFGLAARINQLKQDKNKAQLLALENLKQSDKLKNEFLSNTSHELRTPLNGIIGFAESILDGELGRVSDNLKSIVNSIAQSGYKLSTHVDNILDLSRLEDKIEVLEKGPVNVWKVVEHVIEIKKPDIGDKSLKLINDIPKEVKHIYADEPKIIQILSNLVDNAIKFTSDGEVRVYCEKLKTTEGEELYITVQDTGIGLSIEEKEKIFDKFVQVDGSSTREYSGTGVGLAITKRLIEMHRGEIHVESKKGKYSSFSFNVQIFDGDTNAYIDEKLDQITLMESGFHESETYFSSMLDCKILIVDDDLINQKVLSTHLMNKFSLSYADNGREAVAAVERDMPDLILLDIMMPVMDGWEVCRILREKYDETLLPIIIITARNAEADRKEGLRLGANDYLTKPINKNVLLKRSRTLIHNKRLKEETGRAQIEALEAQLLHQESKQRNLEIITENAHQFRNLLDASFDGLAIVKGGIILEANDGIAVLLGFSSSMEIINCSILDFVPETSLSIVKGVFSGEIVSMVEFQLIRIDKQIIDVEGVIVKHSYQEKQVWLAGIRDISKRKAIEIDKIRLAEMKDQFLANTSHELRTPLNGIIGIAESMQGSSDLNLIPKHESNLNLIVLSAKRLSNLVNDILDFTRIRENELIINPVPVQIKPVVDLVFSLTSSLINPEKVVLINKVKPDLPNGLVDIDRLQQILINLIGNSIKYTEEGEISVEAKVMGVYLSITVRDTGIGISDDKIDAIFESFEQVVDPNTRQFGGAGLGLTVTKHLVESHGGQIFAKSIPGIGSKFTFTIPISVRESGTPVSPTGYDLSRLSHVVLQSEIHEEVLTTKGGLFKILAVDDDPVNLAVVRNFLEDHEYQIKTASGGEEALLAIKQEKPDLVLLDIMMPIISGYDVCEAAREKYGMDDLPIIFLTAKNEAHDLVKSFNFGGNDYIVKPFCKEELLSRVNAHLKIALSKMKLESLKRIATANIESTESQIKKELKRLKIVEKPLIINQHDLPDPKDEFWFKLAKLSSDFLRQRKANVVVYNSIKRGDPPYKVLGKDLEMCHLAYIFQENADFVICLYRSPEKPPFSEVEKRYFQMVQHDLYVKYFNNEALKQSIFQYTRSLYQYESQPVDQNTVYVKYEKPYCRIISSTEEKLVTVPIQFMQKYFDDILLQIGQSKLINVNKLIDFNKDEELTKKRKRPIYSVHVESGNKVESFPVGRTFIQKVREYVKNARQARETNRIMLRDA